MSNVAITDSTLLKINQLDSIAKNSTHSKLIYAVQQHSTEETSVHNHGVLILAKSYVKSRNLDSALHYLNEYKVTPQQDSLSQFQGAIKLEILAHLLYKKGNKDSSVALLDQSAKAFLLNENYNKAFYNYNMVSTIQYLNDELADALYFAYLARDLITNSNVIDSSLQADLQIDIANIFLKLEEYNTADSILTQTQNNFSSILSISQKANISNNQGLCYFNLAKPDLALIKFNISEDFYLKLNDQKGLSKVYNNLALLYSDKFGNTSKSLEYFRKTVHLKKQFSSNESLATSYLNIAALYLDLNYPDSTLKYLKLAETNFSQNNKELINVYDSYSKAYAYQGDYVKAYDYARKQMTFANDHLNDELKKTVQYAREEHNLTLQKAKIDLLNKNKELAEMKLTRNNTLIFILSISFIFLLLIFLSYIRVSKKNTKVALELHEKEIALSSISSLVKGQEKERNRIARDLHDGVGNTITILNLKSQALKNNEFIELTQQLSQEVREISHNIMPGIISRLGLKEALAEIVEEWKNSDVLVDITYKNIDRFYSENNNNLTLYRIIQELINNAVKHGGANYISIYFSNKPEHFYCAFEDNGHGFDTENVSNGSGLTNVKNRIIYLGGELSVISTEEGSSFYITLPKKNDD
ncbi:MAG: histidine kinase [Schleiferiaceae bacterium]|nr:histidine kinase [Schleiferiaceae bacterium]